MKPAPYTVLRDTCEQKGHGWQFEPTERCAGTVLRNLYTADYSLEGYYDNNLLAIERKGSVVELVGNLTRKEKWPAFQDELARLDAFRWPFIVCEFPFALLAHYPSGSGLPYSVWKQIRVKPELLLKRIAEIELAHKARWVWAGPNAKEYVSSVFKRVVECVPCP